jgi:hypothetical protein
MYKEVLIFFCKFTGVNPMGLEIFTILVASANLMMYTLIIASSILARKWRMLSKERV